MRVRAANARCRWGCVSVAMVLCLVSVPRAQASGPVPAGDDIWGTPCGGGAYVDFSANPIPPGYFGPGSDAFSGQIQVGGDPNQIFINPPPQPNGAAVDTIVRRGGTTDPLFGCGSTETVPIEIVALSLVSCAPITVTYGGGPSQQWDVQVCLDGQPQPQGFMVINHECQNGGSYNSSLPVNVQLTFVDPAVGIPAPSPPIFQNVNMNSSGWWSHNQPFPTILDFLAPGTFIQDLCTGLATPTVNAVVPPNFFAGLWSGDCGSCGGPPGTFEKPALTPEQAMLAAHGIFPANIERDPGPGGPGVVTEACCLPPGAIPPCVDVTPFDCVNFYGGIPQGPGTNCANTPCPLPPPPDGHATLPGTTVEFGNGNAIPAIPAGFFDDPAVPTGPSSNPFAGLVELEGNPLVGPSVVLQRLGDPVLPNDPIGQSGTVPIEIVQLNLVSADPITVDFDDGSQQNWRLRVSNLGSSGKDGVSFGQFDAIKTHPNGGNFTAGFFVCPLLTFVRESDGLTATLDLCPDPLVVTPLDFNIAGPFVHNVDPALGVAVPPGATMTTGIEHEDIGIVQQIVPLNASTKDIPPSVIHVVRPPLDRCPPIDVANDPCAGLITGCTTPNTAADVCLPNAIVVQPVPPGGAAALTCDCFTPTGNCGPIDLDPSGQFASCPGVCPAATPGNCVVFADVNDGLGPQSTGQQGMVSVSSFPVDTILTCDCEPVVVPTGACCLTFGPPFCTQTTANGCSGLGTYLGDGTVCSGIDAACCLPDGGCIDADTECCVTLHGGTPGVAGSTCTPNTCPQPACDVNATGTDCVNTVCPDANDTCEATCVTYDPLTGTIVDLCDCIGPDACRVGLTPGLGGPQPVGPGNPCTEIPDNGGTVDLPPAGCDYLSPDEVHMIIEGLPAGTEIILAPIHKDFICNKQPGGPNMCSDPALVNCEGAGGNLGGNLDCFNSSLEFQMQGTGLLAGLNKTVVLSNSFVEVHTGPRTPGDAVQDFDTDMFRVEGDLFGDPDFCTFRVRGGSANGLPSPGHTTLTRLPSGNWQVDSFFDITYQIEFQGCPGSAFPVLQGASGTTTGTVRMATGKAPQCVGGCPAGMVCEEMRTIDAAGIQTLCCNCVPEILGACCLPGGACIQTTQVNCESAVIGGTYLGDGTPCGGFAACCMPDGTCDNMDRACCLLQGGTPQASGSDCNDGTVTCPQPSCAPNNTNTGCIPTVCPVAGEDCRPSCVTYDPLTGAVIVDACDCVGPDDCRVGPAGGVGPVPEGPGNPCTEILDNGGTVELPPPGCDYLSADEVHMLIEGLPAGTEIILAPIHKDFICNKQPTGPNACSDPALALSADCEATGGNLGGNLDCFNSSLEFQMQGTGLLAGLNKTVVLSNSFVEVHTGPRTPGDAVQDFDTDMFRVEGDLFGDPDFCTFRVRGGSANGLPSPGHTTLTRLPSGNWQVDSFFDITYQIEFQGCPGSAFPVLQGASGTTTGTVRMATGKAPQCVGGCPAGMACVEDRVIDPVTGQHSLCCDCVPEVEGACCLPAGACIQTTQINCESAVVGGTYLGDGSACGGFAACCLPDGTCQNMDRECCLLGGGTPQPAPSDCNDGTITCPQPACEPNAAMTGCVDTVCPDSAEVCQPRCVRYVPQFGIIVTDCECLGADECRVGIPGVGGPAPEGPGNPCTVVDNGTGTVTLPPAGCDYLSPDEVHLILDGLPANTTIEFAPIHTDFICAKGMQGGCSQPIPPGDCERGGGDLGGSLDCFNSNLQAQVQGTGALAGFSRMLSIPVFTEVHTAPRNSGDAVQDFDTDMFRLQGNLFGDPDFCELRIRGGSDFGLPSPGHTTLTRLGPPGSGFSVDSFFDITYQIEFVGCPGSALEGMSGTTTATIRMATGDAPQCVGGCPPGQTCVETRTIDPLTGAHDLCCDCVPEVRGACCLPGGACVQITQVACESATNGGVYQGDGVPCGPFAACCLPDGTCQNMARACCDAAGGTPQAVGSDCNDGTVDCGPGITTCPNGTTDECADVVDNDDVCAGGPPCPADGITDDVCVWWRCAGGSCSNDPTKPCDSNSDCGAGTCVPGTPFECQSVALVEPSDMGGAFGNCEPDGFCNNSDINHALLAFATQSPCDLINIDAGGPFGACEPDGFGNLFDANHAKACFATVNPCGCLSGPAPKIGPIVVGGTGLTLESSTRTVRRGATFEVHAFVNDPLKALSGYQLHTGVSGGRGGSLELVDVSIADRDDHVFATASGVFDAFNVNSSQMLSGLHGNGGVPTAGKGYLATFTYRVSSDAVGAFVIDVLHNEADGDQTFMVGAGDRDKIEIGYVTPAVIVVKAPTSIGLR